MERGGDHKKQEQQHEHSLHMHDDALHSRECAPLLLFVCSGNICRSPMAAAIAAGSASREGLDIRVESCGTMALTGDPVDERAAATLAEIGVSADEHAAQQVTRRLVRGATLVVAATREHERWLRLHEPGATHIVSFGELTGLGDIPDPYGGTAQQYRAVRDMLVAGMPMVIERLKATLAAKANETRSDHG